MTIFSTSHAHYFRIYIERISRKQIFFIIPTFRQRKTSPISPHSNMTSLTIPTQLSIPIPTLLKLMPNLKTLKTYIFLLALLCIMKSTDTIHTFVFFKAILSSMSKL